MKRILLIGLLAITALMLVASSASALSFASAKRSALAFSPVARPTVYDTSNRDTKRQGARTLWVHYLAPGAQPSELAPDKLDQAPQLGYGFLVNSKREFIIDYYVAGERVFNSGGSLNNPDDLSLFRNGQPLDQAISPYFTRYWQAINQLSIAWNVPLVPRLPGDKLRWFTDAFYYQVKGSNLYLYTFTGNLSEAFVEADGLEPIKMTLAPRIPFPSWRNPGLQQWRAKISLRQGGDWADSDRQFRFGGCNQFGCSDRSAGPDSRSRFRWNHRAKTAERIVTTK